MVKLCECGCGEPAPIATRNRYSTGIVKGEPVRFVRGHAIRFRHTGPSICSQDGCENRVRSGGLCGTHDRRMKLYGDPNVVLHPRRQGCAVAECDGEHDANGYCNKHNTRLKRHGNLVGKRPRGADDKRFWLQVDRWSGDCWTWQAAQSDTGYGIFWKAAEKRLVGAHRYSYELHHGPIGDGLFVCHRCDNPSCVRPDHLFLGTALDNSRDMYEKGRGPKRTKRTHCPKGHPYSEENTIVRKDGYPSCRVCRKAWAEASYARKKARAAAKDAA